MESTTLCATNLGLEHLDNGQLPKIDRKSLKRKLSNEENIADRTNYEQGEPAECKVVDCFSTSFEMEVMQGSTDPNSTLREAIRNFRHNLLEVLCATDCINFTIQNRKGFNPLHLAVFSGNTFAARLLLQYSKDLVNIKAADGNTALHIAIWKNYIHIVEMLIRFGGADVNLKNKQNLTPLIVASKMVLMGGSSNCFQILLHARADPNCCDSDGNTILHKAIKRNNFHLIKLLCETKQIDFTLRNKKGYNVLHLSVVSENHYATRQIIRHCKQLINVKTDDGFTSLHLAALKSQKNVEIPNLPMFTIPHDPNVELLLSGGADSNCVNLQGNTPLYEAIRNHNHRVFLLLCEVKGINFTLTNNEGFNALHLAASVGNNFAIIILLKKTFTNTIFLGNVHLFVYIRAINGNTALHLAAVKGYEEIVETLIHVGQVDINMVNDRHQTALLLAISQGVKDQLLSCIQTLLLGGADPNYPDCDGNTALHEALRKRNYPVIKLLCESNRIDFTLQNKIGFNPLHLAAISGNHYATRILLKYDKQVVDVKTNDGCSALHLATLNGHREVVETLIKFGEADINLKNGDNQTALLLAVNSGNWNIFELLVKLKSNVNVKDNDGNNALHLIFKNKRCVNEDVIKEFCSDIFTIYENIKHISESGFVIAMACYLVQMGIDIHNINNNGESVLNFLEQTNLQELLETYKPVECLVCSELFKDLVTLEPCNHKPACDDCSSKMKKCLQCGCLIQGLVIPNSMDELKESYMKRIKYLENKLADTEEDQICGVCWEERKNVFFLCGHGICSKCVVNISKCPLCRKTILNKIFIP